MTRRSNSPSQHRVILSQCTRHGNGIDDEQPQLGRVTPSRPQTVTGRAQPTEGCGISRGSGCAYNRPLAVQDRHCRAGSRAGTATAKNAPVARSYGPELTRTSVEHPQPATNSAASVGIDKPAAAIAPLVTSTITPPSRLLLTPAVGHGRRENRGSRTPAHRSRWQSLRWQAILCARRLMNGGLPVGLKDVDAADVAGKRRACW